MHQQRQTPCVLNCATQTAQSDLSEAEPFGAICPILSFRFLTWPGISRKRRHGPDRDSYPSFHQIGNDCLDACVDRVSSEASSMRSACNRLGLPASN
jgi:hypothetical protein